MARDHIIHETFYTDLFMPSKKRRAKCVLIYLCSAKQAQVRRFQCAFSKGNRYRWLIRNDIHDLGLTPQIKIDPRNIRVITTKTTTSRIGNFIKLKFDYQIECATSLNNRENKKCQIAY